METAIHCLVGKSDWLDVKRVIVYDATQARTRIYNCPVHTEQPTARPEIAELEDDNITLAVSPTHAPLFVALFIFFLKFFENIPRHQSKGMIRCQIPVRHRRSLEARNSRLSSTLDGASSTP